ncbi:MAG: hypothetical protein ABW321_16340 [Polyangiales bacterium]
MAKELGVPCPEGTRVLYLEHQDRDSMVRAKLHMSRELYAQVAQQLQVEENSFEPGSGGLGGDDEGAWNPDHTPGLRSTQTAIPIGNFRYMNLSIATDLSGDVTLFVMTHGT